MDTSEQIAELSELAGGFIHEMKNHLSTFNLNLQLLASDFEKADNPRERRALDRIQRLQSECTRLVELSNDFLRFARVESLNRVATHLDELVGEMIDFFTPTAKQAGIEILWYPCPDLPLVQLDRALFKQALLNLMLNAEQAMTSGGTLTLQARTENNQIVLDVIDTGVGISPEVMQKLFRPFHTTKPGGNGLGLPTTRKIIVAHGGTIDVQSEPGRGTRFSVRLPISVEPA